MERAERLHFKSLGGILALQARLADRWLALQSTSSTGSGDSRIGKSETNTSSAGYGRV
jgi:hypothetical protein